MDGHIPPEVHASLQEVPNPINEGKVLVWSLNECCVGMSFFIYYWVRIFFFSHFI
jgi:hypothetical protein